MATKNLGQVSGVYIDTVPPENLNVIWYDNTPSQKIHKVYDFNLSQWVVLNKNVIISITYSELINLANIGLSVGVWYKISDKGDLLALSITSTKVQYIDQIGNILIDDLGSNIQYHVTSSNLLIDDLEGVFDTQNKKLIFKFDEETPDLSDENFLLGKKKISNAWKLVKHKVSSFLSTITGNSIIWNSGFYFNFVESLNSKKDIEGGIISYEKHEEDKVTINQSISNIGNQNQNIINDFTDIVSDSTKNSVIYDKTLDSDLVTGGEPIDAQKGDKLRIILSKFQRYINKFKLATGIRISDNFIQAESEQNINSNDSVESAFGKVQYWFKNISLKLSDTFSPYPREDNIPDLAPGDSLEESFRKVQGKFNQLGILSDGELKSKDNVTDTSVPVSELDLKDGNITLRYKQDLNQRLELNSSLCSFRANGINSKVSEMSKDGIFSNSPEQQIFPYSLGINHGVSIAGLGYGNMPKDEILGKSFIAGVAGLSSNSNSNPAPSYGGYFEKLNALGLYLEVKRITADYNMLSTDVHISCYNTVASPIIVTLPTSPYKGQIVFITQMNANAIVISSGDNEIFYTGNTSGTSSVLTDAPNRTSTFRLIWDEQFWLLNKISW